MINTDEHFLTFGDIKSNEMSSKHTVYFIRHVETTVTEVTVIIGLGVTRFNLTFQFNFSSVTWLIHSLTQSLMYSLTHLI